MQNFRHWKPKFVDKRTRCIWYTENSQNTSKSHRVRPMNILSLMALACIVLRINFKLHVSLHLPFKIWGEFQLGPVARCKSVLPPSLVETCPLFSKFSNSFQKLDGADHIWWSLCIGNDEYNIPSNVEWTTTSPMEIFGTATQKYFAISLLLLI